MVIGILKSTSQAETCLNNLSEADFDLSQVSVVMKDAKLRDAIAKDAGPLQSATSSNLQAKLQGTGLSKAAAHAYTNSVNLGKVLIAINCPPESQSAALDILRDYNPELARIIAPTK